MFKKQYAYIAFLLAFISPNVFALLVEDARAIINDYLSSQNLKNGNLIINARITEPGKQKTSLIRLYALNPQTGVVEIISDDKSDGNLILFNNDGTWVYKDGLKMPLKISKSYTVAGQMNLAELLGIDFISDYNMVTLEKNEMGIDRLDLVGNKPTLTYQAASIYIVDGKVKQIDLKSSNQKVVKTMIIVKYLELFSDRKVRHVMPVIEIIDRLSGNDLRTLYEVESISERELNPAWFTSQRLSQFKRFVAK